MAPANGFSRRLLFACVFFCFAATVNTQTFGLLLVRVADGTGMSVAAMGGLRTIENASSIAVALLLAPVVDRYPRRWPLVTGLCSGILAALILWAFPSTLGAAIYLLLNGFAVILAISTVFAIPGDYVGGRTLTRATGFMIAGFALSEIVFLPVAGRMADQFGWRSAFLLTAAVLGVSVLVALVTAPSEHVTGQPPTVDLRSRYREFLDNRRLLLMLVSALMRFAQYAAITVFLSAVLVTRYGLTVSTIGLVFAVGGVMSFTGSSMSGFLLHARRIRTSLVEGGFGVAAMIFCAYMLRLPLAATVSIIVLVMFSLALQENASTVTVLGLSPDMRGAAMSLNELSAAAGALAGIGLGSLGIELAGVRGLGAVLTILALLGAIVTWCVLRPRASVHPAISLYDDAAEL